MVEHRPRRQTPTDDVLSQEHCRVALGAFSTSGLRQGGCKGYWGWILEGGDTSLSPIWARTPLRSSRGLSCMQDGFIFRELHRICVE